MKLDPVALFQRLASDIPNELHGSLFVTGSLAAAYHFQAQLEGRAINTKDADVVVHPAGNIISCQQMAERLIEIGWTRTEECYPRLLSQPATFVPSVFIPPTLMTTSLSFSTCLNKARRNQSAGFQCDWMMAGMACRAFVFLA